MTVTSHANMSVKTMTSNAARLMNPKPKTSPRWSGESPMRRVVRATREWMPLQHPARRPEQGGKGEHRPG